MITSSFSIVNLNCSYMFYVVVIQDPFGNVIDIKHQGVDCSDLF